MKLVTYATAAFGALVALLFGGWHLLCRDIGRAVRLPD